ncbi:hypothetical protein Aab01nite_53220 [Paractinoplanes abujensis]|uniref:Uncharacterized protein n=1 Tax=Paractinoplanes abujensis TaxID=882441 RepID=A0A7W7G2F7_9ACTN|nr:hypothetical protein [Actinoplanes abujensis]MBB4693609.1 hypothetical protein [Actinoplanes abujensis]GID21732.1 hypothetical protein Aab01nite_53220 [Actinoplanes abujensis]
MSFDPSAPVSFDQVRMAVERRCGAGNRRHPARIGFRAGRDSCLRNLRARAQQVRTSGADGVRPSSGRTDGPLFIPSVLPALELSARTPFTVGYDLASSGIARRLRARADQIAV